MFIPYSRVIVIVALPALPRHRLHVSEVTATRRGDRERLRLSAARGAPGRALVLAGLRGRHRLGRDSAFRAQEFSVNLLELFGLEFDDAELEEGFFAFKPKKCKTRRSNERCHPNPLPAQKC